MEAHYVLAVTLGVGSARGSVEPERVEVTYRRRSPPAGEPGWLFFRDYCWRGELNAPGAVRELVAADLGLPEAAAGRSRDRGVAVEAVELRAFETDEASLAALRDAIDADPSPFGAETAREVLHDHLGSRLEVEPGE